jgi:hypothetical protein
MQAKKKVTRKKAQTENLAGLTALERKVVGKHMLSLQWISWKYFGYVNIKKEADGTLSCRGEQLARNCKDADYECITNDDYIKLDGTIEIVDETHLVFTGDIREKIYHMNNGEEVLRQGTYNFVATGKRKYWRMQEMLNPVGDCADYIDIYFKR